jgi:hypothetical protein
MPEVTYELARLFSKNIFFHMSNSPWSSLTKKDSNDGKGKSFGKGKGKGKGAGTSRKMGNTFIAKPDAGVYLLLVPVLLALC